MSWSVRDCPSRCCPRTARRCIPSVKKSERKITLKRTGRHRRVESLGQMPATYDPVRAAFYVSWDPTSLAALQQHFRDIDLLIPERLHSITATGRLDVEADPKLAAWEQTLQQQNSADQNSHDAAAEQFRRHQLAHRRNGRHAQEPRGAPDIWRSNRSNISHKTTSPGWLSILRKFPIKARRISASSWPSWPRDLHNSNLKLMVCLPAADWIYDYAGIGKSADAVILMNYDQHWRTSGAGPHRRAGLVREKYRRHHEACAAAESW